MKRYHFHSKDGARHRDDEGMALDSVVQARVMAVKFAGEVLSEEPQQLWDTGHWRVEVTDEQDNLLFTVITLAVDAPRLEAQAKDRSVL